MRKKILLALLAILVILQFFRIDKTNPPSDPNLDFIAVSGIPTELAIKFKNACYDCHSHHSRYPWYTNISPLSFWIKGHIKGGRINLNFSTWGETPLEDKRHLLKDCIEEIKAREMPLKSYTWLHEEAKLSEEDIKSMSEWLENYKNSLN